MAWLTGKQLDLDAVATALCEKRCRERLIQNYFPPEEPGSREPPSEDPLTFVQQIVTGFAQTPAEEAWQSAQPVEKVFEAAVRSIGSGGVKWAVFLRREPKLAELLHRYSPGRVATTRKQGSITIDQVAEYVKSAWSSKRPAAAVLDWADLLASRPDFHSEVLQPIAEAFVVAGIPSDQVALTVSVFMTLQPKRWNLEVTDPRNDMGDVPRLPGMGIALSCEFLRNLRWNGVKPDTHIKRIIPLWLGDQFELFRGQATELCQRLGTADKQVVELVAAALGAADLVPSGSNASETDNRIWLLASTIETRRRTSQKPLTNYLMDRTA